MNELDILIQDLLRYKEEAEKHKYPISIVEYDLRKILSEYSEVISRKSYDDGYDVGKDEGYSEGYDKGYDTGYDDGKDV